MHKLLSYIPQSIRPILLFSFLLIAEQFAFWQGKHIWGSAWNPLFLWILAGSIGVYYLYLSQQLPYKIEKVTISLPKRGLWGLWGTMSIILCFGALYQTFTAHSSSENSDVMIVMEALANRFYKGEFPYTPVFCTNQAGGGYYVNAPYLPAFWLPMLMSIWAGIDKRWAGFFVWAGVMFVLGWMYGREPQKKWTYIFGLASFSSIIWLFYFKDHTLSLSSTFESVVIAYYLLLLIGVYYDNIWITGIALLLCLLSRYNLLFWLPILGILYLKHHKIADIVKMSAIVIIGIIGIYVVPFLMKSPDIFFKSYEQWAVATAGTWSLADNPTQPNCIAFEIGLAFNGFFYRFISGTIAERIAFMQKFQIVLLIIFAVGAIYYYFKRKHTIAYPDFAVGTLKIYFSIFFAFTPMAFEYYFMPTFAMSLFLLIQIAERIRYE